ALRRMIGIRSRDLTAVFVTPPTDTASTAEIITPDGHVTVYLQQTSLSAGRREIAMIPIENLSSVHDLKTGLEELPVAVLKLGVDGQLLQANASARSLL
ncbi:hypothetical protein, partial [Halomonas marinisediminis]